MGGRRWLHREGIEHSIARIDDNQAWGLEISELCTDCRKLVNWHHLRRNHEELHVENRRPRRKTGLVSSTTSFDQNMGTAAAAAAAAVTSVTPGSASNKITDSAIHTGDDMIKTIDSVTRPGSNAVTRVRRTRRAVAGPGSHGPGPPGPGFRVWLGAKPLPARRTEAHDHCRHGH